jgi:hypothetical protein
MNPVVDFDILNKILNKTEYNLPLIIKNIIPLHNEKHIYAITHF